MFWGEGRGTGGPPLATLQYFPRNNQPHDFVGALLDLASLGIPKVAVQGVVRQVTVAPEDLDPLWGGVPGGVRLHLPGQAPGLFMDSILLR